MGYIVAARAISTRGVPGFWLLIQSPLRCPGFLSSAIDDFLSKLKMATISQESFFGFKIRLYERLDRELNPKSLTQQHHSYVKEIENHQYDFMRDDYFETLNELTISDL